MSQSSLSAACRFAVGVCLAALVAHTWLVMGLIVPVTVAGSSMAPTLSGPHRVYRCDACHDAFSIELDQASPEMVAICPRCGKLSAETVSGDLQGDRLLVDRTAFAFRAPRRWEVVVFRSPEDAGKLCVKRVVGLPGETVALDGSDVLIDGRRVAGPGNFDYETRYGDNRELRTGWRLGPGEYFVLGDNAEVSDDSRR